MSKAFRCSAFFLLAFIAALAGCGGGGGAPPPGGNNPPGGDNPPGNNMPPPPEAAVFIDFPAPYSYVEGINTLELTVRGRASAETAIEGVTVNGVKASSEDGFATWQATVPLENAEGENVIEAAVTLAGADNAASTRVIVEALAPMPADPLTIARDPGTGTLYLGDGTRNSIYAWNESTPGGFTPVAGENRRRERSAIEAPFYPAWDRASQRVFFLGDRALKALDPVSGEIVVLADNDGKGQGPDLPFTGQAIVDEAANVVYAVDTTADFVKLLRIDIGTGDRSVVIEFGPQEPVVDGVSSVALDPAGRRLFLARWSSDEIVAVDLSDFSLELLLVPQPVNTIDGMAYDQDNDDILYTTNASNRPTLFRYDPGTGTSTLVSGASSLDEFKGNGPGFRRVADVALDAENGKAFVADEDWNTVFTVDLATGNRGAVLPQAGDGSRWARPDDVILNEAGDALYVLDGTAHSVHTVPLNGDPRGILVNEDAFESLSSRLDRLVRAIGSPAFYVRSSNDTLFLVEEGSARVTRSEAQPESEFVIDDEKGVAWFLRLMAADTPDQVVQVDLATGEETIVSGDGVGTGEPITRGDAIARDPETGALLVWNQDAVVLIDPATGDRESRPILQYIPASHMIVDPETHSLLVSSYHGIYRYALSDGSITLVASAESSGALPGLDYSRRFMYDAKRKVIYLVSHDFGTINMIDAVTGSDVILAR